MISPKFLICIAVIFLAAECSAVKEQWNKENAKSLVEKFKAWTNNKLQQFKQKVLNAVQKMKNFKDSLLKKGLTFIHEPAVTVEKDLATWKSNFPEKCLTTAQTQLKGVKSVSTRDFLLCANLTKAFVDSAELFSKSAEVLSKLSKLFSDIFQAVFKCQPMFTSKGFQCARKYVIKIMSDVKEDVPVLTPYFEDMKKLEGDLKEQILSCLHPSKEKLQKDLNNLITSLHTCVA